MKIKNFLLGVVLSSLFCGLTVGVISTSAQTVLGETETTFYSDDYKTTTIQNSGAYAYDHVGGGNNATHGVVPGAWGGTITAGNGYIIYKISADSDKVFQTLNFNFEAKLRNDLKMADNTTKAVGSIKVYASFTADNFVDVLNTFESTGTSTLTYENNLTNLASGYNTIYVKLETLHTAGSCPLDQLGLHLFTVTASGTVKDSDLKLVDDFTTGNIESSHITTKENICYCNAAHPLMPGKMSGGSVDYKTSNVGSAIYKVSTASMPSPAKKLTATSSQATFKSLIVNYNARICYGSKADLVNSYLKVYGSKDGIVWGNPILSTKALENGAQIDYSVNLPAAKFSSSYFIKFEMIVSPDFSKTYTDGLISLSYVPIKIFNVAISGDVNEDLTLLDIDPISDNFGTTAIDQTNVAYSENVCRNGDDHPLMPGKMSGGSVDYNASRVGFVVYKFALPTYSQKYVSLSAAYNAKIAHISKPDLVESYLKVYGSKDGINWSDALVSIKAGGDNSFKDYNIEFPEINGTSSYFVKFEMTISPSFKNTYSDGLIGLNYVPLKIKTISFTGQYVDEWENNKVAVKDDFKTNGFTNSNIYQKDNVCYCNASHPLMPGTLSGGSVKYENRTGYVIYKLSAPTASCFTRLSTTFNAQITHQAKTDLVESYLKVYESVDGSTWGAPIKSIRAGDAGFNDYTLDLEGAVGVSEYYVKFEMIVSPDFSKTFTDGLIGLSYVPIKIATIGFNGVAAVLSDIDVVHMMVTNYMHMESTKVGQCMTLYADAKQELASLTNEQRLIFANHPDFAAARDRLAAWALANGEVINITSTGALGANSINSQMSNELLLIILPIISLATIVGFVLIKKRKAE